jgi:hypothetical protein
MEVINKHVKYRMSPNSDAIHVMYLRKWNISYGEKLLYNLLSVPSYTIWYSWITFITGLKHQTLSKVFALLQISLSYCTLIKIPINHWLINQLLDAAPAIKFDSYSTGQESPSLLCTPQVHYSFLSDPPLDPTLNQLNRGDISTL